LTIQKQKITAVAFYPIFSIFLISENSFRGFFMGEKSDQIRIKEVADILDVSEKTVYRMASEGEIPAFKIGGSWRFKRTEITEWLEKQRNVKKA